MERKKRRKYNRKSCNTHISLDVIRQYLLYGAYPNGSTPSDKRSVRKRSQSFKIDNNELYYVVRPKHVEGEPPDPNPRENKQNLRKAIISVKDQLSVASAVHLQGNGGNHMGTERTLSALSSKYYWVGMAATVRKVLKNCVVCLASRPAMSVLAADFEEGTPFSQTWDSDTPLFLPKTTGAEGKKPEAINPPKIDSDTKCNIFLEGEDQFVVTNELTEPEEADSDLDFEQGCATPDKVFDSRIDIHRARRFWHKVELQVFGPFGMEKSHPLFVIAALDSFSKWPEVQTLESFDEKTVARFCLKIIARFGVMEHLILLENDVSANKPLDASGICQNLQACAVNVSKEDSNPLDESWCNLFKSIERFVSVYTQEWTDCLDLCLLPLRNTVSQMTEFTPAFLLMGREPSFPGSILPPKQSVNGEMSLTTEQISQASDEAMSIYHMCSVPDIKHVVEPSVVIPMVALEKRRSILENTGRVGLVRKSARKSRKSIRLTDLDERQAEDNTISENESPLGGSSRHNADGQRKFETDSSAKSEAQDDTAVEDEEDMFEKISLDTHYRIIHRYMSEGNFPQSSPADFKRKIRRVADAFVLQNGTLMYKGRTDHSHLRQTVMTTKERLTKMSEAHVQNGEHLSQFKVLDCLNMDKLYWKAMHADVRAFVTACPDCRFGETKKKRKPAIKHLRWVKAAAPVDEEDSDAETTSDNMSFEDLWMYIKKGATPDTLSRSALLVFRKKAKSFKIEKGILYYFPPGDGKRKPRKVLRTEKEKQEAIKKAHLGSGDEHLSGSAMKENLRKSVFWYGMSSDLEKFVTQCPQCQTSEQSAVTVETDKQDSVLEERVKLFQDYFAGKDIIPKQESLDLLFPVKEGNADLVAKAMETAEVIIPVETDSSNSVPKEEVNRKSLNQLDSQPFIANLETCVVDEKEVLKAELSDISCEQQACEQNENEEDMEETDENETNDRAPQLTIGCVEQIRTPAEIRKPPLSIPKLPRTRKRCEYCSEVILGENNFKAHMYKHTGVKPFECNQCHKKFTNVKGLRLHSRKHTGHRPFLCNICGRGFPRSASLRYHIKTHDRGNSAPITCDICQRTFTTMNRLIKHKGYKHPAEAPVYSCEQCGKCFTAKRSLKRHEEAHKGIRKYQCQYCKRRFFRKEYLDYHLVSHANEDPSLLENHKFRSKSKRPLPTSLRKKGFHEGLLTLTLNNASGTDLGTSQETYGQVVEVQVPEGWSQLQREQTLVYELGPDETLVPSSASQVGGATTTMVVMEAPSMGSAAVADAGMEVRHIFLPSQDDAVQEQHQSQHSHHAQVQASLPQPPDEEEHLHQQQQHSEETQHEQHHRDSESQPESEIKLSPQIIDTLQHHHQYHNEQQPQQHLGNLGPATVIKLTPEDIVSLQQQQHGGSLDHYQQHQQTQQPVTQLAATGQEGTKSIEISLPSGTAHMLALPAGVVEGQVMAPAGDAGEGSRTVQYQVECLSGETLTEADYNAIRMLAQASLAGGSQHLTQQ